MGNAGSLQMIGRIQVEKNRKAFFLHETYERSQQKNYLNFSEFVVIFVTQSLSEQFGTDYSSTGKSLINRYPQKFYLSTTVGISVYNLSWGHF